MLDILVPTFNRPAALALTLGSLLAQTCQDFRLLVADQSTLAPSAADGQVLAVTRLLRAHGRPVQFIHRRRRRGMAEQRQFLLERAAAPYALFLDDDLLLEPWVLEQLLSAIQRLGCGFVGSAVIGLSYLADHRPHEQAIEFWEGPVLPEQVQPGSPAWQRYRLHNAANLYHVQQRLGLAPGAPRPYKVAWVGGCVLYDTHKLRQAGGFSFWKDLPPSACGEDALAQLRVMARFGGCGLVPSGVYHQELPTTLPDRSVNAPEYLEISR
ncbi:MAG: glycosyltransferase family 2 protein [Chloroflexota bacterium]